MSKTKMLGACAVASGCQLYELMEQAEKSGKPADKKAVTVHADEVHRAFIKQCGLPTDFKDQRWSIGRGFTTTS